MASKDAMSKDSNNTSAKLTFRKVRFGLVSFRSEPKPAEPTRFGNLGYSCLST